MKRSQHLILALFASLITALTAFAGDPSGSWTFKAEGPNGRSIDSTLVLKWENNQLSGTINNRAGKVEISNAKFSDDLITFTVNRKIRRRKLAIDYTGKFLGDTIKGTIQTKGRENKPVSLPWEAQRSK